MSPPSPTLVLLLACVRPQSPLDSHRPAGFTGEVPSEPPHCRRRSTEPRRFHLARPDAADEHRHHLRDSLDTLHLPVFFPIDEDHRSRSPLRHRRRAAVFIIAGHLHHPPYIR
ncbi:uncharacterized protein LOC119327403 [Triticum dicoccoides]|uniref:uncharacterized protein LOC119327403 n=1 Tax=Triticum dicoccoides TaxID=85692 RepID=UPI0018910F83|nr:uncharacterized protein LOC119327403 [Triticum dicoccoides]XP_044429450.1 uncharacterized protein LOC123154903 isoform X1 [Triticum aestivum]